MSKFVSVRWIAIALMLLSFAVAVAGCGDDNNSDGAQTGAGAPDGATGNAAGGAAPEAGKIRSKEDIENEKANFSKEPPPIQIQSGNLSGYSVSKPTAVVIQSQSEENKWRKKVYSGKGKSGKSPWAPTDFKTRQFILVQLPKSKPGTLVSITDVYQNGTSMKVKAVALGPGEDCKTGGEKTNPFHVVETRKMSGEATVELVKQNASAC